jgi:flagellar biosynthetic protein FliQ
MDLSIAIDLGREALLTALMIAGPVLATGIVVGLTISLVQAVTQIQDQTLSMVPKIVAMVLATAFFVPWLAQRALEYTTSMFAGQ